jgi:hypothetical protein
VLKNDFAVAVIIVIEDDTGMQGANEPCHRTKIFIARRNKLHLFERNERGAPSML